MIDEKKLEEWSDEMAASCWTPSFDEGKELIRLAHLGLWAEKHAIPFIKECLNWNESSVHYRQHQALNALPKDTHEKN